MKMFKTIGAVLCLLGLAAPLQAQTCNANLAQSTLSDEFTDHGDGTVTHSRTGLMWKRCAGDQTWTCTVATDGQTWAGALLAARNASVAGHTDWRLPNVKELKSIAEDKCYNPSINTSIFPNTSASGFWSASADADSSSKAWVVDFYGGGANTYNKYYKYQVRLVRAGQSYGSFDATGLPASTPQCTLTATPPSVRKNGSARLSANCTQSPTSYNWTDGSPGGGTCAGTHTVTCDVTPAATTTYSVVGVNGSGTGPSVSATVKVSSDLTPILMLLLD